MGPKSVFLVGCGPQAKYALETLGKTGIKVAEIFDPIGGKIGNRLNRFDIKPFSDFEGLLKDSNNEPARALICLSDNRLKENLFNRLKHAVEFINAIHPGCHIARNADLGRGIIVNAGAVIQPDVILGNGCMLHAGVVVEHDNTIGNFVNLAPGVMLAGSVRVGDRTTMYTGSIVAPNVKIGRDSIIGAGSLVLSDIPDRVFAYGSPAKIIRENP